MTRGRGRGGARSWGGVSVSFDLGSTRIAELARRIADADSAELDSLDEYIRTAPQPGYFEYAQFATRMVGAALRDSGGSLPPTHRSKTTFASLAIDYARRSYVGGAIDDDTRAIRRLVESFDEQEIGRRAESRLCFGVPEVRQRILAAAKWAACGLPLVVLGHKYAAALMATSIADDCFEVIEPPFPSFVIDVPDGLLAFDGSDECPGDQPVGFIVVTRFRVDHEAYRLAGVIPGPAEWKGYYCASSSVSTLDLHRCDDWPNVLREDTKAHDDRHDLEKWIWHDLSSKDDRCHVLIQRLIAGVCLAMSDPNVVTGRPTGHRSAKRSERGEKRGDASAARFDVFRIGSPIKIDCRSEVSDYLSGRRRTTPTVRSLVRGHWKRQHHGERNSRVKVIWVQPYWKGPLSAPITLRPHVLAGAVPS